MAEDEAIVSVTPVDVETGRVSDEVSGSSPPLPPFPPLPVGEGTAGEVDKLSGDETVELRTSEEETSEGVAAGSTTEVDEISDEAGGTTEEEDGVELEPDALSETVN